ncbi:MAG: DUF3556 domain-containing protein [Myxococcota bacterium]
MGLLDPVPLPYDPLEWARRPFHERSRMVSQALADQGYGAPVAVYLAYGLKVVAYIGGWLAFCSASPSLGGLSTIGDWWLEPLAFQKAIVWSMLFEVLGLGCGSGPLTGRYLPPMGGFLYFLRPGTTKSPLRPGLPVVGGRTRTWLDAALYLALLVSLVRVLLAPAFTVELLVPIAVLVPVLGVTDKTIFLAARAEHYWMTVLCFVLAADWLPAAKAIQLALWWWAGVSKLNHHFPYVVCVMTSNSPLFRFKWLRRRMYRSFPDDLRPSRLAVLMGHMGTALELGVPVVLVLGDGGPVTIVGLVMMFALHGYITSNVPMGVPIEWNFMVVYAACFLFGAHADVSPLAIDSIPLAILVVGSTLVVPFVGNILPRFVSFLPSMRYYAGNWAYGVWLFRGDSHRRLDEGLVKSTPWIFDQLDRFYDRGTSVGLVSKLIAFRMLHLHGRGLPGLLDQAVGDDVDDYQWVDGEVLAGSVIGWNFGDGHLHHEDLLRSVQAQCGFEPGELRCIFVESQPLFQQTLRYRIHDASTGPIAQGELHVEELRKAPPWALEPSRPPEPKME